jgi:hypothetical protein
MQDGEIAQAEAKLAELKAEAKKESNTALWESVFKTDPKHTKAFQRSGGFKGTAIKPLYLMHKATELWGPLGDAWTAESVEHVIQFGMVFIKARVTYPPRHANLRGAFVEHWGGDVLTKGEKATPNDEAFKMAFTDAVGKCLVQLGFSADVHMGLFEDAKYVADLKAEFADDEKPETKVESECFESVALRDKFVETFIAGIERAPDLAALKHLRAGDKAKLDAMAKSNCDADVGAFNKIIGFYNPKFRALQKPEAKPATVDSAVGGLAGDGLPKGY